MIKVGVVKERQEIFEAGPSLAWWGRREEAQPAHCGGGERREEVMDGWHLNPLATEKDVFSYFAQA